MDLIKPLRLSSCVASGIAVRCPTWGGTHEACSDIDVDVPKWHSVFLSLSLFLVALRGKVVNVYRMTSGKRCPTLMLIRCVYVA